MPQTERSHRINLRALIGLETAPAGGWEQCISAVGGLTGMLLVWAATTYLIGEPALAGAMIASVGASAVLVFAAPHGPMSQPWPVIGGHVLSAAAGVACQQLFPDAHLAAPAAVGLAIGVMYYASCLHPPGGATALTAVLGGPAVHAMGYRFVVAPVLLDAVAIMAAAVAFNAAFPWRRYPAVLARRAASVPLVAGPAIAHEHLAFALRQMGSFVDVTEADLAEVYALAAHHAAGTHLSPDQVRAGGFYARGPGGRAWGVRHVVEVLPAGSSSGPASGNDVVLYWSMAGTERSGRSTATRAAFALWAREEVTPETAAALAHVGDASVRPGGAAATPPPVLH